MREKSVTLKIAPTKEKKRDMTKLKKSETPQTKRAKTTNTTAKKKKKWMKTHA